MPHSEPVSSLTKQVTVPAERLSGWVCAVPDRRVLGAERAPHMELPWVLLLRRVGRGRTGCSERQDEFHMG